MQEMILASDVFFLLQECVRMIKYFNNLKSLWIQYDHEACLAWCVHDIVSTTWDLDEDEHIVFIKAS